MNWITREKLDEDKWNQLRLQTEGVSIFSRLEYLDCVAQNCLFLIHDDYRGGMAFPYFERMGVKTLYTPVFCRYVEWLGEHIVDYNDLNYRAKSVFKEADVYTRTQCMGEVSEPLIYQGLNKVKLNTQAKRKIKKAFENPGWELRWDVPLEDALERIEITLRGKFVTLKSDDFFTLRNLCKRLYEHNLLNIIGIYENDQLQAALILMIENGKTVYLKGAASQEVKLKGGMYLMMQEAVEKAIERGDTFDFGGSRIDGVRKFNLSFGGEDCRYYRYSWSNGPLYYRLIKKLRNRWRKK